MKSRTTERKKRKKIVEEPVVEKAPDEYSITVSLGERESKVEEEEEKEEVQEPIVPDLDLNAVEANTEVEEKVEAKIDMSSLQALDLEPKHRSELDNMDDMSRKRRNWNRTASSPAALGEDFITDRRLRKQETTKTIESQLR